MITKEAIKYENRKIGHLRMVVDLTSAILKQSRMTRKEAENLIDETKNSVLKLFPDKEDTFDLILKPRLQRIIDDRFNYTERIS